MKPTLSFKFQMLMYALAAVFWLLGLIPVVNDVSYIIYDIIVGFIFAYKYRPIITHVIKSGISVGSIYLKIGLIFGITAILNLIPFVSWIPWDVLSTIWINKLTKEALAKIEQITKDVEGLKKGSESLEDQRQQAELITEPEEDNGETENYAEDGEEGRIKPPKPRVPQPNFNYSNSDLQGAGRMAPSNGIIK